MKPVERSDEPRSRTAFAGKRTAAVVAALGFALFAAQAEASCETDDRVAASDSECLWETHTSGTYTAANSCLHKITIKIDIRNGRDTTRDINAGWLAECHTPSSGMPICSNVGTFIPNAVAATYVHGTISTSWWRSIRAITCCSDLTDCNRRSSDSYPD